jgi:putative transposase
MGVVRRPSADELDIARWPSVDLAALANSARRRFQDRALAIEHYCRGDPIDQIEEESHVDRRVIYRMIERAVKAHPDGRPWGFRALIPGMHVRAYQRLKTTVGAREGLAGSFRQLLDLYPPLEQLVKQLIVDREVLLIQVGDRLYLKNLKNAHRLFTDACRLVGLTANDYPLNQDEQGRRSLASVLRDRLLAGFAEADWPHHKRYAIRLARIEISRELLYPPIDKFESAAPGNNHTLGVYLDSRQLPRSDYELSLTPQPAPTEHDRSILHLK